MDALYQLSYRGGKPAESIVAQFIFSRNGRGRDFVRGDDGDDGKGGER